MRLTFPRCPGVLGLELVRHYNSAYSGTERPNLRSAQLRLLGRGWKLSYEVELISHKALRRIDLMQADGSVLVFYRAVGEAKRFIGADPANGELFVEPHPATSNPQDRIGGDYGPLYLEAAQRPDA